jgi:hypothetical protein
VAASEQAARDAGTEAAYRTVRDCGSVESSRARMGGRGDLVVTWPESGTVRWGRGRRNTNIKVILLLRFGTMINLFLGGWKEASSHHTAQRGQDASLNKPTFLFFDSWV